jgi:hypothetical protein
MAAGIADKALEELLAGLVTPQVIYFPIRHHSPACAWQLDRLIRKTKPRTILVEGPESFTSLIPLLLHPKTRAPVAIYTSFVAGQSDAITRLNLNLGPPRFAAYYPFCDYSPELVALRTGSEVGAGLRFIDLDYADQMEAHQAALAESGPPRVESLLDERHFRRSAFLRRLAQRAGCRDHNDLWDHLFETRLNSSSGDCEQFIRDVASWCYFARLDTTSSDLKADGTLYRETAMAANIRAAIARDAPVIVVTGGFHTIALPRLVAGDGSPDQPPKTRETLTCLVRYSFEQLDALNGYAAGMPSPFYYDQVWRATSASGIGEPFTDLAAKTLVQLGQLTRRKKMAAALSPADEIAGLEQARRLAALRGHPGPTREDLLDGIRSCFVKGSMDAEGEILLALARRTLAGAGIGEVPAEAGVPPLVENFRATAKALRLSIRDSMRRSRSLDLYRKTSDRTCSRFFHSLDFLGVPFATMAAGPDFVRGIGLERLHEHWNYHWTPQTESSLVEASIYGADIEEAAANRLLRATVELETQGRGRSALEAVAMLVHACRMGLHRYTEQLRALIAVQIAEDPDFKSLAGSLNQLILLWESREPLEAHRLPEIPELMKAAYLRASYLLQDLANTPADGAQSALLALIVIRDVLHTRAARDEALDPALLFDPLLPLVRNPNAPPLLAGGAAGILYGADRIDDAGLLALLTGFLNSAAVEPGDQMGFLVGLLRTCRELAWRQPALLETIERLLGAWGEEEFIERLPHLRLAFADLTPRETDQVAGVIADLHGGQKLGQLMQTELSEAEMMAILQMNAAVKKSLDQDGLAAWIAEVPT